MGDFLFGILNSFMYLYDMEAKLYKVENTFYLKEGETILGTSIDPNLSASIRYSLSLKNCEVIVNGYDLDELISDIVKTIVPDDRGKDIWYGTSMAVGKQCFQKSLEVNDDKRFTLEDMMNCWNKALKFQDHKETLGEHIQSLQRTEWKVEICCHIDDHGTGNGSEDSFSHPMFTNTGIPKYDADGNLILKRK